MQQHTLTGRFNPEHEYRAHHSRELSKPPEEEAWDKFKARFPSLMAQAVDDGVFAKAKDVDGYFRRLAREGQAGLDNDGAPELRVAGE